MTCLDRPAETWGRLLARYSRWVVRSGQVAFEGDLPAGGAVAVSWHGMNLIALGAHAEHRPHPFRAFVPPGLAGAAMRGLLKSNAMEPVPLPPDGVGNPATALKEMARVLKEGVSVAIALDGPRGPSRVLRPGALWLARLSGKPLVVVGVAARPALPLPRWDRHLVPFPGAQIAIVYGPPILVDRRAEIDEALRSRVAEGVDTAERRAWAILDRQAPGVPVREDA